METQEHWNSWYILCYPFQTQSIHNVHISFQGNERVNFRCMLKWNVSQYHYTPNPKVLKVEKVGCYMSSVVQYNITKHLHNCKKSKDILKLGQCIHTIEACSFIRAISSCYNITVSRDNFYVWDITLHDVGQSTREEKIMEQY